MARAPAAVFPVQPVAAVPTRVRLLEVPPRGPSLEALSAGPAGGGEPEALKTAAGTASKAESSEPPPR